MSVEMEAAQSRVTELEQQLNSIDRDATEMGRLTTEERRLVSTRIQCDRQASELSAEWTATEQVRDKVDRLAAASGTAMLKRDSIASEQQRRQELIGALDSRVGELKALDARAQQSVPALAAAINHVEQTAAALEATRAAVSAAEAEQRHADEDRDHHRNRIEVEQLSERHERVVEAEKKLQEADKALESVKVDDDLLRQIEEAHLAVVSAEAAVASVETTAARELSIRINGEEVVLGAGETQHTVVDDDLWLVVPDAAEIRVRAGTGSQSLATQRRHARQEFRRLCAAAGVADQSEARQAAEERREAERQRRDAREAIKRDLRDLTVDVLRGKIEGLTERIKKYATERPEDSPLPPDFETAKQIAAAKTRILEEKRSEFDNCDQTADSASSALQEERINESNLAGMIRMARNARRQAADSLESARSRQADSAIASELA